MATVAHAILGLSVGAAMPLGAQQSPALMQKLRHDVVARGLMEWSPDALPDWTPFAGTPRLGTATAAETSTGVTYLIQCRGEALTWAVLATFSPTESWVRPDILVNPAASPRSLRHEQTHFHISELLARRVRREFARLSRPCPGGEEKAHAVFQRLAADGEAFQTRFDDETRHGLRDRAEARWESEVLHLLRELAAFADADPPEPSSRRGP